MIAKLHSPSQPPDHKHPEIFVHHGSAGGANCFAIVQQCLRVFALLMVELR
jgi:hypothetical protein